MYGLNINISKSVLVGVECLEETTRDLEGIIKCRLGRLLIIYLGFAYWS